MAYVLTSRALSCSAAGYTAFATDKTATDLKYNAVCTHCGPATVSLEQSVSATYNAFADCIT